LPPQNDSQVNVDLSDEEIAKWSQVFVEESEKTSEELLHESIHLLHHLNDIEMRLSEHRAIEAHIARFGTSETRRRKLMGDRSDLRIDVHDHLNRLHKDGMTTDEMYEKLPFLSKPEIERLLRNEP
jgi:hypothetical protein